MDAVDADSPRISYRKPIILIVLLVVCILVTLCLGTVYWWPSATSPAPCDLSVSIPITDGDIYPNGSLEDRGTVYPPGYHFSVNGTRRACPCRLKPCIRKCCPEEEIFFTSSDGFSTYCDTKSRSSSYNFSALKMYVNATTIAVPKDYFYIVHGDVCIQGKFQLDPSKYPEDENYLTPEGKIIHIGQDGEEDLYYDISMYCLDYLDGGEDVYTFTCAGTDDAQTAVIFRVQQVGMILSSPLLLATLMVYVVLPDLRNLPGKCLMCNVASLLTAYIVLPALQITGNVISIFWCSTLRKFSFMTTVFLSINTNIRLLCYTLVCE